MKGIDSLSTIKCMVNEYKKLEIQIQEKNKIIEEYQDLIYELRERIQQLEDALENQ